MILGQEAYMDMIDENLEYVEELQKEVEYWQKIYQKRVFDGTWPESIQRVIDSIKLNIKINLDGCQEYLLRIKELKNDAVSKAQPIKDDGDATIQGTGAGDTNKVSPEPKPEDLGPASKEVDDNRGENEQL